MYIYINQLKWIKVLNTSPEAINSLMKTQGYSFMAWGLSPKQQATKEKLDKGNYIKCKNFCARK